MNPVIQLEPTGCAIASVAAIVGLSYGRAKSHANSLGIFAHDPLLWSDTAHIRKLLQHFGVKAAATELAFKSLDALPDLALLALKWHIERGQPFWHWAVFVRDAGQSYVIDPNKQLRHHRRTDFGRMKPKWFIQIADTQTGAPHV